MDVPDLDGIKRRMIRSEGARERGKGKGKGGQKDEPVAASFLGR
jgi:hypothetical protein